MQKRLPFRVVVAGSRTIIDRPTIHRHLETILCQKMKTHAVTIISGCAKGPDTIGAEWALAKNLPVEYVRANWEKFGKQAGMLRNQIMNNGCDAVIAFHDGKSSGTANMIQIAQQSKRMIRVINCPPA